MNPDHNIFRHPNTKPGDLLPLASLVQKAPNNDAGKSWWSFVMWDEPYDDGTHQFPAPLDASEINPLRSKITRRYNKGTGPVRQGTQWWRSQLRNGLDPSHHHFELPGLAAAAKLHDRHRHLLAVDEDGHLPSGIFVPVGMPCKVGDFPVPGRSNHRYYHWLAHKLRTLAEATGLQGFSGADGVALPHNSFMEAGWNACVIQDFLAWRDGTWTESGNPNANPCVQTLAPQEILSDPDLTIRWIKYRTEMLVRAHQALLEAFEASGRPSIFTHGLGGRAYHQSLAFGTDYMIASQYKDGNGFVVSVEGVKMLRNPNGFGPEGEYAGQTPGVVLASACVRLGWQGENKPLFSIRLDCKVAGPYDTGKPSLQKEVYKKRDRAPFKPYIGSGAPQIEGRVASDLFIDRYEKGLWLRILSTATLDSEGRCRRLFDTYEPYHNSRGLHPPGVIEALRQVPPTRPRGLALYTAPQIGYERIRRGLPYIDADLGYTITAEGLPISVSLTQTSNLQSLATDPSSHDLYAIYAPQATDSDGNILITPNRLAELSAIAPVCTDVVSLMEALKTYPVRVHATPDGHVRAVLSDSDGRHVVGLFNDIRPRDAVKATRKVCLSIDGLPDQVPHVMTDLMGVYGSLPIQAGCGSASSIELDLRVWDSALFVLEPA